MNIGDKFGRLTVESFSIRMAPYMSKGVAKVAKHTLADCLCECGNRKSFEQFDLRKGKTSSCGCLNSEVSRINHTTHGGSTTPLYNAYATLLSRCYNPNVAQYSGYGGRGITVCPEWRHSFGEFQKWALTHGYEEGLQIDRRDNNKGYSPDNCRYVPQIVNAHNTGLLSRNNNTGFRGVNKNLRSPDFQVRIKSSLGPKFHKYGYKTAEAAALARDILCIRHDIPLPLNFPELLQLGPL